MTAPLPQNPLLILDIDQTLIYATKQPLNRTADFTVFDYHVYRRPHLNTFIERVSEWFDIAIWSSAGNHYVQSIIRNLNLTTDLQFVWSRNEATAKRQLNDFYETGADTEYYYVKRLKKVKRKGYQLERILIVDDSPHKSQLNYGNAIYPKPYLGALEDDELLKLLVYLNSIKDEPNFRTIEKRNWRNSPA